MKKYKYTFMAVLTLVFLWEILSIIVKKDFIPSPLQSVIGFVEIYKEKELVPNFIISLYRIVASGVIAVVTAVPLGILMGRKEGVDRFVYPFISILYPIPKIVFLPIFIVFLGLGSLPKILIITIIVFFQILVIVRDAVKNISGEYIFSFETLSKDRMKLYMHVVIPAITADIITALRISVGSSIAVLFFAETFAAQDGLGYIILDTMEARNYPQMYGGIIAMSILGILIYECLSYFEKRYSVWR